MKRRRLCLSLLVALTVLVSTSCAIQPAPAPPSDVVPTSPIVTVVPIPTLRPTNTAATQVFPTVQAATATPVAAPNTRTLAATRTPFIRFAAPTQLEPAAGALFKDGNDIKFVYASAGRLEQNQCYLLHVELAVPNLEKGNRGDDFVDVEHCGDPGPAGKKLTFVLYRGKFINSPNYGTMLARVRELAPEAKQLKMTWTVHVVQNNGRAADGVHYNTVPLSPESPASGFDFQP